MTGCKDTWGDVVIPDSYGDEKVVEIRNDAFVYCVDLTSVTIPASVTKINQKVFKECPNLTDIYFAGTEEQWNAFGVTFNGTVHYIN